MKYRRLTEIHIALIQMKEDLSTMDADDTDPYWEYRRAETLNAIETALDEIYVEYIGDPK